MEWQQIALIVTCVVLALGGIYIKKLVGVIRESGELLTCIAEALEDNDLTSSELIAILKEAKDVGKAALEVANLIARK